MREGRNTMFAKYLRRNMTESERTLWRVLGNRAMAGFKFRRQHPIGPYIVDFACLAANLVIEVDGGQHCDSMADVERDAYFRTHGFNVLRFWNNEVCQNIEGVCDVILRHLGTHTRLDLSRQASEKDHA